MKRTILTFCLALLAFATMSAQMTFILDGYTYDDVAQRDSKGFTTVTLPAGTDPTGLITDVLVDGKIVDPAQITPNPTTTTIHYDELKVFTYQNRAYGFLFTEDVWFCAVFISDCHTNQNGHDGTSASDLTAIMQNIMNMGSDGKKKVSFAANPNLVPKTSIVFCLGDIDQDNGDDGSTGTHTGFLNATAEVAKSAGVPFIFIAGNHDLSPDYWSDGSKGVTYGSSGGYNADKQTISAITNNNNYWSGYFDDGITYFSPSEGSYDFEPNHFTFKYKDVRFYCANNYWFQKPYDKPGLISNTNGTMYAPDGIISSLNTFVENHTGEASVWMQHYPWIAGSDCNRWWLDQNETGQYRTSKNSSVYGSSTSDIAFNDVTAANTLKKNPLAAIMMKAAGRTNDQVQHFSGHYHLFAEETYTSTVNSDNQVHDYTVAAPGNNSQSNNAYVVLFKRGEGVKEVVQTQF